MEERSSKPALDVDESSLSPRRPLSDSSATRNTIALAVNFPNTSLRLLGDAGTHDIQEPLVEVIMERFSLWYTKSGASLHVSFARFLLGSLLNVGLGERGLAILEGD